MTMARMGLKVWTLEDSEHVGIQLEEDGKPLGHIFLDGPSAEKVAHDIGRHRAGLKDEVTPELDPNSRLAAIVNPGWKIPGYKLQEGRILALRHPGLGWVSFVIPEDQAERIADWLTKDLPIGSPKA
jgi:hypothetical protein